MSCGSHCLLQVESHHKLDGKSAFQPIRIGKQLSNLLSSSNQNSQSLPRQTETLICKFQPSRLLPNQFQEKSGFHVKMAFQQQKSAWICIHTKAIKLILQGQFEVKIPSVPQCAKWSVKCLFPCKIWDVLSITSLTRPYFLIQNNPI